MMQVALTTELILILFASLPMLAVSSSAQETVAQYGHQSEWYAPFQIDSQPTPSILWSQAVGDGRSQIVTSKDKLIVTSATNRNLDDKSIELIEKVEALQLQTGERIWQIEVTSQLFEGQENFSGTAAAPQATPLIVGNNVIWIGFTGVMQSLELETGKQVWRKDLVPTFGAKPVQFGFAASPAVNPQSTDRFYVMAAGANGGLLCLNVQTGELIWRSACDSFSYATPTLAVLGNVPQILIVSEDSLIGIAQQDGKQLWSHPLANSGLTNVPTPLIVDSERVLIAGQGCGGVRCLKITQRNGTWASSENWHLPKIAFFYQNWIKLDENLVMGCTDKFLAVIDVRDGRLLGRWRGFADANLSLTEGNVLALTGLGRLKLIRTTSESGIITGLENWAEFQLLEERCWTPLTLVEGTAIVRGGNKLMAVTFLEKSDEDLSKLKNLLSTTNSLRFEK